MDLFFRLPHQQALFPHSAFAAFLFLLANSQFQDVLLHLIYGLIELSLGQNLELVKCTWDGDGWGAY